LQIHLIILKESQSVVIQKYQIDVFSIYNYEFNLFLKLSCIEIIAAFE